MSKKPKKEYRRMRFRCPCGSGHRFKSCCGKQEKGAKSGKK